MWLLIVIPLVAIGIWFYVLISGPSYTDVTEDEDTIETCEYCGRYRTDWNEMYCPDCGARYEHPIMVMKK